MNCGCCGKELTTFAVIDPKTGLTICPKCDQAIKEITNHCDVVAGKGMVFFPNPLPPKFKVGEVVTGIAYPEFDPENYVIGYDPGFDGGFYIVTHHHPDGTITFLREYYTKKTYFEQNFPDRKFPPRISDCFKGSDDPFRL